MSVGTGTVPTLAIERPQRISRKDGFRLYGIEPAREYEHIVQDGIGVGEYDSRIHIDRELVGFEREAVGPRDRHVGGRVRRVVGAAGSQCERNEANSHRVRDPVHGSNSWVAKSSERDSSYMSVVGVAWPLTVGRCTRVTRSRRSRSAASWTVRLAATSKLASLTTSNS
jgi:hypothetical protein